MSCLASRRSVFFGLAGLPTLSSGSATLAPKSDLARACELAVARRIWIDQEAPLDGWPDARIDEECDKNRALFDRALAEPSRSLPDLVAKARLCLDDREQFTPEEEHDDGVKLVFVVLREVIALCG